MGNVVTAPPNEAGIVSGLRGLKVVVGGCRFQWWIVEQSSKLSLQLITLQVESTDAETTRGVRVSVKGICQVKVDAFNDDMSLNHARIRLAAQHFLNRRQSDVENALLRTMEGHQRQILGTLTVEELYKDRKAFSDRVTKLVSGDLSDMGFQLVSYTVTSISDNQGYMQALGATQTSLVKREAQEGTAKNEAEARKKTMEYKADADIVSARASREAHVSVNEQKQVEAAADRDLNLKKAEYMRDVNTAKAQAEAAYVIEKAVQEQQVVKEVTRQEVEKAQVLVEVAEKEASRIQKEKEGESLAVLIQEKNKAEAIRVTAEADASRISQIGDAEAGAVRAKGEAEADVLRKKAEAYKEYGEAAIVQSIVDQLPAIADSISQPLANTDKMVFISNDGSSGSKLTKDIVNIMSEIPDAVDALTGVDLKNVLKRIADKPGQ